MQYPRSAIDLEKGNLEAAGICVSNDIHIVALARISGSRLLYSKDDNLCKDFKNLKVLNPKGKIYSTFRNKALLAKAPKCRLSD